LTKNLFFGLVWSRNLDKNAFTAEKPSIKRGLPVEKKAVLKAALISVLLFSAVAGTQLAFLARANPYRQTWEEEGEVAPPEGTLPPAILILSPKNNTAYASNNVSLTFNVRMPESNNVALSVREIYYRASWQQLQKVSVNLDSPEYNLPQISINLTDVPEGPRWLTVYATAKGFAHWTRNVTKGMQRIHYYVSYNEIIGCSMVNFTIDTTPPIVSALSVDNKTYCTSNVTLNVMVNEPVSQVIYSLDGQGNVSVAGNTTLTDLAEGKHNLTVCVLDSAGNTGNSETTYFSVDIPEPFPKTLEIASVVVVAVIVSGLLVNFKKHKW
jgi:hypothetical protein